MEPSTELKVLLCKLLGSGEQAQEWWSSWNQHLNGRPDMLYRNNTNLVENYIYWMAEKRGIRPDGL